MGNRRVIVELGKHCEIRNQYTAISPLRPGRTSSSRQVKDNIRKFTAVNHYVRSYKTKTIKTSRVRGRLWSFSSTGETTRSGRLERAELLCLGFPWMDKKVTRKVGRSRKGSVSLSSTDEGKNKAVLYQPLLVILSELF